MDIDEYRDELIEDVKAETSAHGMGTDAAFAVKIVSLMQEHEVVSEDYEESFYIGVRRNKANMRVDGYIYDELDDSMSLFIVCFFPDDKSVLTKTAATAAFKMLKNFVEGVVNEHINEDMEPSTPVADLADMLVEKRSKITRYNLFLLTNAKRSARLLSFDDITVDGAIGKCQIWDIERIFELYLQNRAKEPIHVDFMDYVDGGLPCLEASEAASADYKSYLCVMPGSVLADVYDMYGSRLLEGNVRSFLSSKKAVNKKIRATILNEPTKFFAYNNGIAATAMKISTECAHGAMHLKSADDFQIINGGQTTASLSNARFRDKADLSHIYVQMKITVIGDMSNDKAEQLIRDISRSSNSQNKVSEADFFSTHPFHIEMEKISRRISAPAVDGAQYGTKWFYERARGQYLQEQMKMSKAQKKTFERIHPKSQCISKTDFAKYRMSWGGHPDVVSKGAETNFMKFAEYVSEQWDKDSSRFNEKYFKETIAIAIMFKSLEKLVSRQPWYNSYRANIVTYSLALFSNAVNTQFKGMSFNFKSIWNTQKMPELLVRVFEGIAKDVNDFITGDNRPVANVTQWCKRELCWKNMKENVAVKLPEEAMTLMESAHVAKKDAEDAKKDQAFISATDKLSKVIAIDGKQWQQVLRDAQKYKCIATQKELMALRRACKIPNEIPQEFQAQMLLDVLLRLKEEGHKYSFA